MNSLLEYNRVALFEKLNKVPYIQIEQTRQAEHQTEHQAEQTRQTRWHLVLCDGIIDCCSHAASRDRRIISDFTADEVQIYKRRRYFTLTGLTRYTQDGHIVNYVNLCLWAGIIPDIYHEYNKLLKKIKKGPLFITISLIKFLFGRRVSVRGLNPTCTVVEFLQSLTITQEQEADQDRLKYLKQLI
jgi:hypothetical protein